MSRRLKQSTGAELDDPIAEAARRNHDDRITELQSLPAAGMSILRGVQLANGVATKVAHKLGRDPAFVGVSVIRGATSAGFIVEANSTDRKLFVVLTATGYGATIIVDLQVL